jgi:4-carboxymuconolactone decarboxylase
MPRVPNLTLEELSPEQRRLHDEIAAGRERVGGPFAIWLRTPSIAEAANRFGNVLRRDSTMEKRLFELMVLVVARHWTAQYEWFVHEKAGLPDAVIESVRAGQRPAFERDDEALVYDVTHELMQRRRLSDAAYERALTALGQDQLIEFITAISFYTSVAVMLNGFDVPTPDGSVPVPASGTEP